VKNLNRRLLLGAALGAATAALPFACAPQALAQQADPVYSCPLCRNLGRPLGIDANATPTTKVKIARSSGDAETDRFLGRALGRISGTFGVSPGFAFYDDSAGLNALAVRETLIGNGPGTVLMGMHLFGQLMARVRDGGITVIAVCAHEFGHIYQMQAGYERRLGELDKTDRPFELHADFLSGYYLALRKAQHPELDLSAVGRVLHSLGDSAFASRQHHGTPEERVGALAAGFKFGLDGSHDIAEAARAGFLLVRQNS